MRWPLYVGAGGLVAAIAWVLAKAPRVGPPLAPSAVPGGPSRLPVTATVKAVPGSTYFATLETNGVVNAAASVAKVKAKAESEGFRDVVVTTTRVANWPGLIEGDYFVRATFAGAAPKDFPRHVGVPLGSLNVLDAWVT